MATESVRSSRRGRVSRATARASNVGPARRAAARGSPGRTPLGNVLRARMKWSRLPHCRRVISLLVRERHRIFRPGGRERDSSQWAVVRVRTRRHMRRELGASPIGHPWVLLGPHHCIGLEVQASTTTRVRLSASESLSWLPPLPELNFESTRGVRAAPKATRWRLSATRRPPPEFFSFLFAS